MSIIASILTENIFYIATDTLCITTKEDGNSGFNAPLWSMHSKIDYHPHLKCCVVGLGVGELSNRHRQFVRNIFCLDVSILYQRTVDEFVQGLDLNDPSLQLPGDKLMGLIAIFGYSDIEKKMVAYTILVMNDGNHSFKQHNTCPAEGLTTFMSPRLDSAVEEGIMDSVLGPGGNAMDVLLAITQRMHADSLVEERHVLTVGGEVNFTIIGMVDGVFTCNFSTPYRFPDYEDNIVEIMKYRLESERVHAAKCRYLAGLKKIKELEEELESRNKHDVLNDNQNQVNVCPKSKRRFHGARLLLSDITQRLDRYRFINNITW